MSTPLTHPELVAVSRLHALLELLPTELDRRLAPAGVTAFEFTLLDILSRAEGHRMRLSELGRKTNATLPRLSRVVSSLERRALIARTPCLEDGRATNAVLTPEGIPVHELARALYTEAVRDLILPGLGEVPGDGVTQLANLSFSILKSLDPEYRDARIPKQDEVQSCSADPVPAAAEGPCPADPSLHTSEETCAADPLPSREQKLETV